MLYYGFILPDGSEIGMTDNCRLHETVALNYIKENYLFKEYRNSDMFDPVDFMVSYLGAIKVGNQATSTSITVSIPYFSDIIRKYVEQYRRLGYRIDLYKR